MTPTIPPVYLKIRESPKDGVYVQGLREEEVKSYSEIAEHLRKGDNVSVSMFWPCCTC